LILNYLSIFCNNKSKFYFLIVNLYIKVLSGSWNQHADPAVPFEFQREKIFLFLLIYED